jgi:hypothetical protein
VWNADGRPPGVSTSRDSWRFGGFDVNTVGYILLIVGIVGLIVSMIFWSSWAGPGFFTRGGGRRVVEEDVVDRPRRRVIEEDV